MHCVYLNKPLENLLVVYIQLSLLLKWSDSSFQVLFSLRLNYIMNKYQFTSGFIYDLWNSVSILYEAFTFNIPKFTIYFFIFHLDKIIVFIKAKSQHTFQIKHPKMRVSKIGGKLKTVENVYD